MAQIYPADVAQFLKIAKENERKAAQHVQEIQDTLEPMVHALEETQISVDYVRRLLDAATKTHLSALELVHDAECYAATQADHPPPDK